MTTAAQEQDHSQANAAGWASTISELVAALECDYDRKEELNLQRNEFISEADDKGVAATVFDATDEGKELSELTEASTIDGYEQENGDSVREGICECPLSVEVRSGWYAPGECNASAPEEFMILLSTGGPALRIMGELGEHNEPTRAWLEYQDWGTPWTHHYVKDFSETLLTFCQQFYFGE